MYVRTHSWTQYGSSLIIDSFTFSSEIINWINSNFAAAAAARAQVYCSLGPDSLIHSLTQGIQRTATKTTIQQHHTEYGVEMLCCTA